MFDIDAILDAVERQAGVEKQTQIIRQHHKDRCRYIKKKTTVFYIDARVAGTIKHYDNEKSIRDVIRQGARAASLAKHRPYSKLHQMQKAKQDAISKGFSDARTHAEFVFASIFNNK